MFTPQQLASEINTDPKALGFGPLKGPPIQYAAVAAKLNTTYAGVATVWRSDLSAAEIVGCLVWSEVAALTTQNWLALHTVLLPGTVDASQSRVRDIFTGLFAGASFVGTRTNLTAVAAQPAPTRAEELWGHGTRIAEQDVANALAS